MVAGGRLMRWRGSPVISPRPGNGWEARQTFNPGAVLLEGGVHLLYRALGEDGISRLGYALLPDGLEVEERLDQPVYQHLSSGGGGAGPHPSGGGLGGAEDPRLVWVRGEGRLYMTYTAYGSDLRVALTSIDLEDFLDRRWRWAPPRYLSPPGETHKNWVIFPERIGGRYALLHSLSPEVQVDYLESLELRPGEYVRSRRDGGTGAGKRGCWDGLVRGAGPPPLRTELGWLLFYHAMDLRDPGRYKVGAMLLALEDPRRVILRSAEPILEPRACYEEHGFKPGVVYATGAAVVNGRLMLYYGASDSYVCVATCDLEGFLKRLLASRRRADGL